MNLFSMHTDGGVLSLLYLEKHMLNPDYAFQMSNFSPELAHYNDIIEQFCNL